MLNFSLLAAEIVPLVWSAPAYFSGFCVLASLLQRHRLTEASQSLHSVWPLPGLVDYIYTFGSCCFVTEFRQVQNSLRAPSLALSCWQRYCMAVEQWAQAKLCGVEHRVPIFGRATITLGIGPHSSVLMFPSVLGHYWLDNRKGICPV